MVDPPPLLRPVAGPVAARYSYDRAAPFRRGRRRVVRLSSAPGAPVRAPCSGRVSHAGRVPGGSGVTVRCGAWSVTLTGVTPRGVARGRDVRRGRIVAGAAGRTIALGLRRTADPFGYVDPLPLLRAPAPSRPLDPLGPAPRSRPVAPAAEPVPPPRRVVPARPGRVAVPSPATTPVLAWVGLGVAALGIPAGMVRLRVRRRERVRARGAATQARG